jgi:hypothetical protein
MRNKTVYTGKVGNNTKPKAHKTSSATPKTPVLCQDGVLQFETLYLSTPSTLTFTYKGQTGRYNFGRWEAAV